MAVPRINKNIRLAVKRGTSYPAVVTDVIGNRASAKLSIGGATVHNLKVVGGPIEVGEVVNVDYTTPEPTIVAAGKSGLSEGDVQKILRGTGTGVNPKPPAITGDMFKSTYDTDDNGVVDEAESITSGSSGDGDVLTADGVGGSAFEPLPTLANHDHSGDVGDGGTFDAANLGSGAAANGAVLAADGSGGAAWEARYGGFAIVLDGGGSQLSTGVHLYFEIPFDCEIVSARLMAKESGSIVIDLWKDTYANSPPTVADSITASAKPTLSSAQKSEDTTLTGWTKTLSAGNYLGVNVDSVTTITQVTLSLRVLKT